MLRSPENKLSRPIVRIATGAIAVGVALMMASVCVLKGFQREIRDKAVGFGAHIQVVSSSNDSSTESERFEADQDFYHTITEDPSIRHIQQFALKPGIMETAENLQGIVIKGIASDFDSTFFAQHLSAGRILRIGTSSDREIMISAWQARRLELEVDDRVRVYVVQQATDIKPRTYTVAGIYETGLEEYDRQYVFVDQLHVAKSSGWGLEAQIRANIDTVAGTLVLEGLGFGGDPVRRLIWDDPDAYGKAKVEVDPCVASTYQLIVKDRIETLPDTAWITVTPGPDPTCCTCGLETELTTSGGSYQHYTGGFEITIADYEQVLDQDDEVFKQIPFYLQTRNVLMQNAELFNWLRSLDINVIIIIALVVFISVINMTSAMLIIILEKTRMIGLLKALGITDGAVIRIFLRNASHIIGRGVILGNLLGIGLCLAQSQWAFITLDPANYFVDTVPIAFDWWLMFALNVGTLATCVLFLVLPALYVTRISPVKAIRWD